MKRKIRCGGRPMTAIVLAGGRGRRMRADKAALPVGGRTLLEHVLAQVEPLFEEVLVSVSPGQHPALHPRDSLRVVQDETPGLGPIGGLLAGLKAARNDACLAVAVDIPDVDAALVRTLARTTCSSEITVPVGPNGFYEPLFAIYRKSVVSRIEALLADGERSLLPLFDLCRTVVVHAEAAGRLRNLNTRGEYESYLLGLPAARRARRSGSGRPPRR